MSVTLESAALRVTVNPRVGGTITGIVHKANGLSVLGKVPWQPVDAPLDPPAAPDEALWLTRYTGGWPLLFPNGGDACTFDGTFHGFHGEASIGAWQVEAAEPARLCLWRNFVTVPVRMEREIALDGDLVVVRETAEAHGAAPIKVMWGHHPTFGSDLLDGDFELQSGARQVRVDQGYDPPTNPLRAGSAGKWPLAPAKNGDVDLRRAPKGRMAALAFLREFDPAWVSIRRLDDAVAIALSWDGAIFPYAWLWYELEATEDAPWNGRTRLIGLEPNSTCSANGLADAAQRGERLLELRPGSPVTAIVRLQVFEPSGPVTSVTADGRAVLQT